jgi:hypothetical protein
MDELQHVTLHAVYSGGAGKNTHRYYEHDDNQHQDNFRDLL